MMWTNGLPIGNAEALRPRLIPLSQVVGFCRHKRVRRRLKEGATHLIRKPALEFEERSVFPSHAAGLCGRNQHHTSETWDNGISLLALALQTLIAALAMYLHRERRRPSSTGARLGMPRHDAEIVRPVRSCLDVAAAA